MKTLKIFLLGPQSVQEIRRITVSTSVLCCYTELCKKIADIFPALFGKTFCIKWKDEEGDNILISSDEELTQAVANADADMMKIYVNLNTDNSETEGKVHPHVTCDSCNGPVKGCRYKCMECDDYDLCNLCNTLNKHPQHDMLKITSPSKHANFPGWKFMYGRTHEKFDKGKKGHGFRHGMKHGIRHRQCGNATEYLTAVGNAVSEVLGLHGIDVDVDVQPPAGSDSTPMDSDGSEKQPNGTLNPSNGSEKQPNGPLNQSNGSEKQPNGPEEIPMDLDATQPKTSASLNDSQSVTSDYQSSPHQAGPSSQPQNLGARPKSKSPPISPSPERSDPLKENTVPKTSPSVDSLADMIQTTLSALNQFKEQFKNDPAKIHQTIVQTLSPQSNQEAGKEGNAREKSPPTIGGLFGSFMDDWTMINPTAPPTEKDVNSPSSSTDANEPGAASNQEVKYPDLSQNMNPESEEPKSSNDQDPNAVPLEEHIQSALIKMKSMGFSDESGWLSRLLQAKNGNIAEAVESMYPNAKRH